MQDPEQLLLSCGKSTEVSNSLAHMSPHPSRKWDRLILSHLMGPLQLFISTALTLPTSDKCNYRDRGFAVL